MGLPPNTSIRTSHAVSIRALGIIVGQIQTWAPSQSRTITPAYQLASTLDGVDSGEVTEAAVYPPSNRNSSFFSDTPLFRKTLTHPPSLL